MWPFQCFDFGGIGSMLSWISPLLRFFSLLSLIANLGRFYQFFFHMWVGPHKNCYYYSRIAGCSVVASKLINGHVARHVEKVLSPRGVASLSLKNITTNVPVNCLIEFDVRPFWMKLCEMPRDVGNFLIWFNDREYIRYGSISNEGFDIYYTWLEWILHLLRLSWEKKFIPQILIEVFEFFLLWLYRLIFLFSLLFPFFAFFNSTVA